jgi:hypothetical protein
MLGYPNNVFLYFLYYGQEFVPKDKNVTFDRSFSPVSILADKIELNFEELISPDLKSSEMRNRDQIINILYMLVVNDVYKPNFV